MGRQLRSLLLCLAAAAAGVSPAKGADFASLQFTVPAPDPVQAGETLALQALAVNTGAQAWPAGSYYWVGEIYDLDYKLLARTDQVSPREAVASGGVASISLPFRVPETAVGRRLYRVFLIKDTQKLVESDYRPFQIVEKPIPPAPDIVDYRLEGNVTVAYKNSSRNDWEGHDGATTINAVGKIKESSYLFNAYFLHKPGEVVDPFIVLLTYYAPWGTIYAGDILPSLTYLSVDGQGMRGAMFEQQKGPWSWALLGGQTVTSQPGTDTTNGRFSRTIYAGRGTRQLPANMKVTANYFLSQDEPGSLSTDPNSPEFRGPTLVPQKNNGYGLAFSWEPKPRMTFLADYQRNTFYEDTSLPGKSDTAWRGEFRWDRERFRAQASVQRAGTDFVAFGAPGIVGDRLTYAGNLGLFPVSGYSTSLSASQFSDNLANDPSLVTTTQRLVTNTHSVQLRTGTSLNASLSLNAAQGKPRDALDNETLTAAAGVSQVFGGHSVSLNATVSQFEDKNDLAHDLDTVTYALSSTFALPRQASASLGASQSDTKDKIDGSKRATTSVSPSYSKRIRKDLVLQVWGTYTKTKSDSPVFPTDVTNLSANTEVTWARTSQLNLTLGLGYNDNDDKLQPTETFNEVTFSTRLSYSF